MTDDKTTPADENLEPVDPVDPAEASPSADPAEADAPVDSAEAAPAERAGSDAAVEADEPASPAPSVSEGEPEEPAGDGVPVQYGVGPLSIREAALAGVWGLSFALSFFPAFVTVIGRFAIGESVWNGGLDWVLTVGVPTVAVFLVLLRRFSPQGIRRVGSLGLDQFASVAFSVAAVVWLAAIWAALVDLVQRGVFTVTWVAWVQFFLMVLGVALTVLAPHLPVLGDDFRYRQERPAHRNARPVRPITARPPRPVATVGTGTGAAAAGGSADDGRAAGGDTLVHDGGPEAVSTSAEPFAYVSDPAAEPAGAETESPAPVQQAFWALVPEERDVVDEQGAPLFRIGPTAWALVIEDRGEVFVIRHEDGRVGYLHDVTGVTRG